MMIENETYDCRMDYFSEIKKIKATIANLENKDNDVKTQMDLAHLKEALFNLTNTIDLMASCITGRLHHYSIACRDNLNHCYEEKNYMDYNAELKKFIGYQKIEIACTNLTPAERDHFMNQYNELKEAESKIERVR